MKKSLKVILAAASLSPLFFGNTTIHAQSTVSPDISSLGNWHRRPIDEVIESIQSILESGSTTYTVQWGDTLSSIASATGIHIKDLIQINAIANPDFILAGATITFNPDTHTIVYADSVTEETEYQALNTDEEKVELNELTESYLMVEAEEFQVEEIISADLNLQESLENEVEALTTYNPVNEAVEVIEAEELASNLAPATQTLEAQAAEEPVIEEPVVEEPIIEEPVVEQPVVEEPVVEEPVVEEPVVEEPVVEEPIVEEPVIEEPVVEEPVIEEPIVEEPASVWTDASGAFNQIVADKGIGAAEAEMWSFIIGRESSWNHTISNPSSGAYGLPQALPGSKMASHGADWQTNPYTQLAWMYDYMVGRYGSISGAHSFWQNNHWY